MDTASARPAREFPPAPVAPIGSAVDTRRWLRDLGALLALPAMWVDHEPPEIATGLLSVLFGILQLDGAYARFDDGQDDGRPLESWRPTGGRMAVELRAVLEADPVPPPGLTATEVVVDEIGTVRVASLPIALPWETGLVLVSAGRADFPNEMETHLLRVAVSQAAIAVHTARRIRREHAARLEAEAALSHQNELLRGLVEDAEPSLAAISRRIADASRLVAEVESAHAASWRRAGTTTSPVASDRHGTGNGKGSGVDPSPQPSLTRREMEVLGLLAQGLSNKEIAGVMWLSDRTVERHITSLYRKIGVARRSEATAFALRNGMG
ncbi:DNA-binding NarL/FixJ family response regulator [Agromyces sp. 3263]|uniref:helix-turn-helix transcriptional regulator n=1 Tax=Agromyces sp. 3263 TaxID=2817750 RepID=UPI00285621E3|nr:helix-turn-helix transcriptional regulator [Agromyces sp. 3263]MDR6905082.1 DNA-binding NarL/FixJ family response regulator [Agromyces sp. 3263]